MNSCHAESWDERSPLGAESALHVGQEVLHWGQRWKNFSKREKQTNKKKQQQSRSAHNRKTLSTPPSILQNLMCSTSPWAAAIPTRGSMTHGLVQPAPSHLSAQFSLIWLTCYKAFTTCLQFLWADRDVLNRQRETSSCCSPDWTLAIKD